MSFLKSKHDELLLSTNQLTTDNIYYDIYNYSKTININQLRQLIYYSYTFQNQNVSETIRIILRMEYISRVSSNESPEMLINYFLDETEDDIKNVFIPFKNAIYESYTLLNENFSLSRKQEAINLLNNYNLNIIPFEFANYVFATLNNNHVLNFLKMYVMEIVANNEVNYTDYNNESENENYHGRQVQELNKECSICFSEIENIGYGSRNCNHLFHLECIRPWIDNGNNTCPNCRGRWNFGKK